MGDRELRGQRTVQEREWDRLKTELREVDGYVSPPGCGELRMRLIVELAHRPGLAWDFLGERVFDGPGVYERGRIIDGVHVRGRIIDPVVIGWRWRLFRSEVVRSGDPFRPMLKGFEELEVPGDYLGSCIDRVLSLSLPLRPLSQTGGGLDGTYWSLRVLGHIYGLANFRWCADSPPPGWEPLDAIAEEMIDTFTRLPPRAAGSGPGKGGEGTGITKDPRQGRE